jgi:hypothetical protein
LGAACHFAQCLVISNTDFFKKLFGTSLGIIISFGLLLAWTAVSTAFIARQAKKKDF